MSVQYYRQWLLDRQSPYDLFATTIVNVKNHQHHRHHVTNFFPRLLLAKLKSANDIKTHLGSIYKSQYTDHQIWDVFYTEADDEDISI